MARPRRIVGIRRRRGGWRVNVRVNGKLLTKQFEIDTPMDEMRAWRADQVDTYSTTVPASGSFAADIQTYLQRVAAMPTHKQRAAHLALWAHALGGARARRTITPTEIDQVLQDWLLTASPATVRKRRTALQSLFVTLDGKLAKNPVKATANPKPPKPEARGLDYLTIARILAAMPTQQSTRPGAIPQLALGTLRVAVLAYTGIPPGLLQGVTATDLQLTAGTVRVHARRKGRGTEPRTLPLTTEGLAAFKAFHAADAYGRFAIESVNRSFKRAAKRIGIDPRTVHLYDLRHSFGMELYRVTRDLATVARFLGHAPGSVITARYAQGANALVDQAAAAAFSAALATQRQQSLKATPTPAAAHKRAHKLPAKVTRIRKTG
jgi:integrase